MTFCFFQPSVSIGNVGQLAVDVLLSSVSPKPEFVSSIYHPSIIPVVGTDPLNLKSDQLMTACQLYKTENEAILQLRSGLLGGQRDLFLNDLINWIGAKKFAKVVILTSTTSDERLDNQIRGSQFRFISNKFENELK